MFHLLIAVALTQAPIDVPPAAPSLTVPASAPFVERLHLVQEDPAQGSFRWREIGGGVAGAATGYMLDIGVVYAALRLSPQASSVRWVGYDVRYRFQQNNPPVAANLIGIAGLLVLPNVGAALGALWASDGPHSGGFWRALLYGYAGELAVLVAGGLATAALGGDRSTTAADVTVAAMLVSPGVMSTFGLHGGDEHWVPAPAVHF